MYYAGKHRSIPQLEGIRLRTVVALVFALVYVMGSHRAVADEGVPEPLVQAVSQALAAWGGFADTGDLTQVDAAFVVGGPQHRRLVEEAPLSIGGTSELLSFTIKELRVRTLGSEQATVWAEIEATRFGFESQTFFWDFDLLFQDGLWRVWTVVGADRPKPEFTAEEPEPARSPAPTTPTLATENAQATQPTQPVETAFASVASESKTGIRLPVLSAWIIVVSVLGVALAGYLAPRLDRRADR